ncbi:MAG: hypothetical protein Q4D06_01830 [Coriobacteriia bacterium]|nr:hypothetical protein [Coriobacteriia bacterium]
MPNKNLTDKEYLSLAKSLARTSAIAIICAAVSMFIGGIALSTVGVLVALVSFVSARKVVQGISQENQSTAAIDEYLAAYSRLKATLIAAVFALIINVASVAYIWPQIQEYLATGDPSSLSQMLGGNGSSNNGSSGFWGSGSSGTGSAPSSGGSFW